MNQLEDEIIEALTKFVQEDGSFALLLSFPNGLVKFHSSDDFKSYIDLFTQGQSDPASSQSPAPLNNNVDTPKQEPQEPQGRGLIPLVRALESPTFELHLSSKREVMNHLRACFREMQQLACKTIAKAWIKAIEPKKQTNFPYNRGNDSRPPWWPSHIRHCEPDHLVKSERIDLLVGIARHEDTDVKKLRDATNRIPSLDGYRLKVLDEVYLLVKTEKEEGDGTLLASDFENGTRLSAKKRKPARADNFRRRYVKKVELEDDDYDQADETNDQVEEPEKQESQIEDTTLTEDEVPVEEEVQKENDIAGVSSVTDPPPSRIFDAPPSAFQNPEASSSLPEEASTTPPPPKRYTFRDFVKTTPIGTTTTEDGRVFPNAFNLQMFSASRVDPEVLEQSSRYPTYSQSPQQDDDEFEQDDHIVSEVLKIRDYNIKHGSNSKSGAKRRRYGERVHTTSLGPPLFSMRTNEHIYSGEKIPVFKDDGNDNNN